MNNNRKGLTYHTLSQEERQEVWDRKCNGQSCQQISNEMDINYKTVQSIKGPSKVQEYQPLITTISEYTYDQIQQINYQSMNEKKLDRQIRQIVRESIGEKSKFSHLIPENKQASQKRRIIQQIVQQVKERLLNNPRDSEKQRTEEYHSESENRPISDTLIFEDSQFINNQGLYFFESSQEISSEIFLTGSIPVMQNSEEPSDTCSYLWNIGF